MTDAATATGSSTGAVAPPDHGPPQEPPTPSRQVPALELTGVSASYGRIRVLHGVDLTVPAGSVFALLGPNGAGKSTLLKVAGGRMRASAGSVLFEGQRLGHRGANALVRAGLCSIPEGRGIFPNLSVRENLWMWTFQGSSRQEAEERAFARFPRLATRRRQLAGTLSGGEQQMLAFARAFVGRPRVLLLDEISMGLAPMIVGELYEVVSTLAGEGMTIVLAEQFVHTALGVATHAALVTHGRITRTGSPSDVAATAMGDYLRTSDSPGPSSPGSAASSAYAGSSGSATSSGSAASSGFAGSSGTIDPMPQGPDAGPAPPSA